MSTDEADDPADDWADRHVARWSDHWIDVQFDPVIEAAVVRMQRLVRHLDRAAKEAVATVGLEAAEYKTLHALMIRDTPGHAAPSALAADLAISAAGMTGRLDALEAKGWVRRSVAPDDRRRVDVEVTTEGLAVWRRGMRGVGGTEEHLLEVLTAEERDQLARLLKRLSLAVEP